MRLVDLTHDLEPGMPLFPGTPAPVFEDAATLDADGYREKRICLNAHTGTHIDAPAHILERGVSLDRLPVDTFWGQAVVVDCTHSRGIINLMDILPLTNAIQQSDFVIVNTGWHRFWGERRYFCDFPVLSRQAAAWLADAGLKGIGTDILSVDPLEDTELPIHRILLAAGMVIVENLANLNALPAVPVPFSCLPLKIRDADGSPVRAVAVVP